MSRAQIDDILVPLLWVRARVACGSESRRPDDPPLQELDQQIDALRLQRMEAVEQELGHLV